VNLTLDQLHVAPDEPQVIAHAIGMLMPELRRLDRMIESDETRRDRAYRELERRRASLAKQLRDAVKEQAEMHVVNDEATRQAA